MPNNIKDERRRPIKISLLAKTKGTRPGGQKGTLHKHPDRPTKAGQAERLDSTRLSRTDSKKTPFPSLTRKLFPSLLFPSLVGLLSLNGNVPPKGANATLLWSEKRKRMTWRKRNVQSTPDCFVYYMDGRKQSLASFISGKKPFKELVGNSN